MVRSMKKIKDYIKKQWSWMFTFPLVGFLGATFFNLFAFSIIGKYPINGEQLGVGVITSALLIGLVIGLRHLHKLSKDV